MHGGEIIAQGLLADILKAPRSLTGAYLSGKRRIEIPKQAAQAQSEDGDAACSARSGNNLKNIDLTIHAGLFTCITGVSGSGKSTLINDTLYPITANELNGASQTIAPHREVEGMELFDKVVDIDQSPIGRTPRSNPATYTGLFTPLARTVRAGAGSARPRLFAGRFSFNVRGGRCEACQGDGLIKVEMHFLPDVYVPCDVCHGKRYNRETLEILYKGYSIHDVLEMTVEDALKLFEPVPTLARKLETLIDVGLSYIKLGQSATTLSGGEAQRVKLSKELSAPRYRAHAVHPRRADHRPAFPRHRAPARRAAQAARRRQHHRGHRTQPGCDQDRRLGDRPRPGRRPPRRPDHRRGHARGTGEDRGLVHRPVPGQTVRRRQAGQEEERRVSPDLFQMDIPVRWRDLDAFNHVNNASYLGYVEEARVALVQVAERRTG